MGSRSTQLDSAWHHFCSQEGITRKLGNAEHSTCLSTGGHSTNTYSGRHKEQEECSAPGQHCHSAGTRNVKASGETSPSCVVRSGQPQNPSAPQNVLWKVETQTTGARQREEYIWEGGAGQSSPGSQAQGCTRGSALSRATHAAPSFSRAVPELSLSCSFPRPARLLSGRA